MDNEKCRRASLCVSERFLMKFELLSVDRRIRPLQRAHGFHILILVIDYDYVSTEGILHGLHPMGVNDTGCHFVFRRSSIDETELENLRSHFLFVCFDVCSNGRGGIRHVILSSSFVLSGLEIGVKDG